MKTKRVDKTRPGNNRIAVCNRLEFNFKMKSGINIDITVPANAPIDETVKTSKRLNDLILLLEKYIIVVIIPATVKFSSKI